MDKTIVIGLGNPIMCDDGVGIQVVRLLKKEMGENDRLTITEAYAGGIRLMDVMTGYARAIIIDAMATGTGRPGAITSFSVTDLVTTKNTVSSHDTSLHTALETGRLLGLALPEDIQILGIEAEDLLSFGEELTEDVAKAVPLAVSRVMAMISVEEA